MSRFYGRLTNGGKPVQREGHSARGIVAHVFGARYGVRVRATVDGADDTFAVDITGAHDRHIGTVGPDVDGNATFVPVD